MLALDSVTSTVAKSQKADEDAAVNVTAYKKFDFGESGASLTEFSEGALSLAPS